MGCKCTATTREGAFELEILSCVHSVPHNALGSHQSQCRWCLLCRRWAVPSVVCSDLIVICSVLAANAELSDRVWNKLSGISNKLVGNVYDDEAKFGLQNCLHQSKHLLIPSAWTFGSPLMNVHETCWPVYPHISPLNSHTQDAFALGPGSVNLLRFSHRWPLNALCILNHFSCTKIEEAHFFSL